MKAITLHGLLAIVFLNFLFSHVLSNIPTIESRVPVIFGHNGTLTPFLNPEWTHYGLLKREDSWHKALRDGQEYVDKLKGARKESPWSTVDELRVRSDPIPSTMETAVTSARGRKLADTSTIRQMAGRFQLQPLIQ